MVSCSIPTCGNSSKTCNVVNKGITFHSFPKDRNIKDKWISAIGRRNWYPTNHSRICSVHFKEKDFNSTTQRRNLLKTAVPTIDIWKLCKVTPTDEIPETSPSSRGDAFTNTDFTENQTWRKTSNRDIPDMPIRKLRSVSNNRRHLRIIAKQRLKIKRLQNKVQRYRNKMKKLKDLVTRIENEMLIDSREQSFETISSSSL